MKRKFYIVEIMGGYYPVVGYISETELKARIDTIISLRVRDGGAGWDWKKAIEILLNGEDK